MSNIIKATNRLGTFSYFSNDEYIGDYLSSGEPWEGNLLDCILPLLNKEKSVLDIGSNIGTHTIPYSKHCKTVHAFEPQIEIFDLLKTNITDNQSDNVIASNLAVGHKKGKINLSSTVSDGSSAGKELKYGGDNKTNYGGIQLGVGGREVDLITIDSLDLNDINYMKVDVEGAETMVFHGARETIVRNRPIILYEKMWKNLCQTMKDSFGLEDDVCKFSISEFCSTINYYKPLQILNASDFLLFPNNDPELSRELVGKDFNGGNFRLINEELMCVIPKRGNFQVFCFEKGKIYILFHDCSQGFVGTVTEKYEESQIFTMSGKHTHNGIGIEVIELVIEWSNGTKWSSK
jgi:FkbM family methyltransferase